jgi:hypothetical protein
MRLTYSPDDFLRNAVYHYFALRFSLRCCLLHPARANIPDADTDGCSDSELSIFTALRDYSISMVE